MSYLIGKSGNVKMIFISLIIMFLFSVSLGVQSVPASHFPIPTPLWGYQAKADNAAICEYDIGPADAGVTGCIPPGSQNGRGITYDPIDGNLWYTFVTPPGFTGTGVIAKATPPPACDLVSVIPFGDGFGGAVQDDIGAMDIDPDDGNIWAAGYKPLGNRSVLYKVNRTTGAIMQACHVPFGGGGEGNDTLAIARSSFCPSGKCLFTDAGESTTPLNGNTLLVVDAGSCTGNAAVAPILAIPKPAPMTGIDFEMGKLIGADLIFDIIYSIDGSTLTLDAVMPLDPLCLDLEDITMKSKIGGIGHIKPGTPFIPDPAGSGRAIAYDGINLYYTLFPDTNIYKIDTAGNPIMTIATSLDHDADGLLDEDPVDGIDNDLDGLFDEDPPGPAIQCGALSWDGSQLWCGSYDGTGNIYTINPINGAGVAMFQFSFDFLPQDNCFGQSPNFIDGLAYDPYDGTLWISDDGGRLIVHLETDGTFIGVSLTPKHPFSDTLCCNSGIDVAPGGHLELSCLSVAGKGNGIDYIVKIPKNETAIIADISSPEVIVSFPVDDIEDIAYDDDTFGPRCALWTNQAGAENEITAYDVQCTRSKGYWKNHPEDALEFLPLTLGDDDTNGVCETVSDAEDVEDIMKDHKGQDTEPKLKAQLLAAKLNITMGDIPNQDFAPILEIIADADELLGRNGCDPDTGNKGADRAEAQALHSALDDFNNKY